MNESDNSENDTLSSHFDGGRGDGLLRDKYRIKTDIRLATRAILNGWPVPPSMREVVMEEMVGIVMDSQDNTEKIGAARAILSADAVNAKREHTDMQKNKETQPKKTVQTLVQNLNVALTVEQLEQLRELQSKVTVPDAVIEADPS